MACNGRQCSMKPGTRENTLRMIGRKGDIAETKHILFLPGTAVPFVAYLFNGRGIPMSKETPKDDPRQKSDQGSHKQTDKPWKGNPEKEQRKRRRD